jgi:hypothetical protein
MTITLSTHELTEILEQLQGQTRRKRPPHKAYSILIETPKAKFRRRNHGNGNGNDRSGEGWKKPDRN